ncbi:MAG: transglutaminase family protein [Phycisphaeraceae bacterium]|nr:transglutaminase family protein [Phycisphaeraceae bacterium]
MSDAAKPIHCRPAAFSFFANQLPNLETPGSLERGAVAIAMHAMPEIDPLRVEAEINSLAETIRSRVRSGQVKAILAHAHEVLFEEEGFTGSTPEHYYSPDNSYIPIVLRHKRGLPITLTLIYKAVLGRLGLRVYGINAPSHFLAGVQIDSDNAAPLMLVDPFSGGNVLSRDEAFEMIEQAGQPTVTRSDSLLQPATHRQWLGRMLMNLQHIFYMHDRRHDLAAVSELQGLLGAGA